MIINRIYENQNLLSLQLVSFLVGLRTYQHPCTYSEIVFVALGIQHTNRMRRIVICGQSDSSISFHTIPKKVRFSEEKKVI